MTYSLLAYCNERNAAELAKADRCAVSPHTLEFVAPPSFFLGGKVESDSDVVRTQAHKKFSNADKISCGEPLDSWEACLHPHDVQKQFNVCRQFDERHMERVAAGRAGDDHSTSTEYFREIELRESLDEEKALRRVFKQKVEGMWPGGSFDVPFHEASEMGLMGTGLAGYPFSRLLICSTFTVFIDTPQTSDYCMRNHCVRLRREANTTSRYQLNA